MKTFGWNVLVVASVIWLLGCGGSKDGGGNFPATPAPYTGNELFETETVPEAGLPFRSFDLNQKIYYVHIDRLNVRSTAEIKSDNVIGALGLNDEVKIIKLIVGTDFAQVEIIKTPETIAKAEAYFVSKNYLSENKNVEGAHEPRAKYFMVQNVATEKLRIYEKMCDDGNCAHKMIFETDIAVGEKTKDQERMTALGSFNIVKWVKYYRDGGGTYPSWYDPELPMPPRPGAGVLSWTRKNVLPNDGSAKVRGAFGWFTALVGPDSHNQWTHGTIGWGADKDKYIRATRGFWANLFTDPRSHGCTRTDNESIAYIRYLLDTGTPVIKVYAVEALTDKSLSRYTEKSKNWEYIQTKNGVREDGQKSDRDAVLASLTPQDQWLEQGTYTVKMMPTVKRFRAGSSGAKSGKNGNVYGLGASDMKGVFLIDEGRLVNYEHPAQLEVGGYGRSSFPAFLIAKNNPAYSLP